MFNLKTAIWRTAVFLDRWHWLLLAVAAPFLWFPSSVRSLALMVIPVVWLAAWMARGEPLPSTPLSGTLLLLSLMLLVSFYARYDIVISFPRLGGMVLAIGTFYAVAREGRRPGGWWAGFLCFLGIGLGFAGLGLLGMRGIAKFSFLAPLTSRLPSRFPGLSGSGVGFHPNQVAGSLLWVIPVLVTVSVLLLIKSRGLRIVLGGGGATVVVFSITAMTLFVIAVFVLTQSRGGYTGFALTILVLVGVALSPRGRRLFLGGLIVLAIAGGIVLSRQGVAAVWEGLTGSEPGDASTFLLNTLQGRLELWSRAIYGIQDFPFTGMGIDAFRYVVHVLYPLFLTSPDTDIAHAHNEFLQVALDLGIPGLIAFVALYIGAFWMLREVWRLAQSPAFRATSRNSVLFLAPRSLIRAVVLGLGGGLFAHLIYGLTDAVVLGAKQGILFWMLLGLISGLFSQARSGRLVEWAAWPGSWVAWPRRTLEESSRVT